MGNYNSGRRPNPQRLREVLGETHLPRHNHTEPQPPVRDIAKPVLSTLGGLIWDELAPICLEMGTLTTADVATFATLCELEATRRFASKQKDPRTDEEDPEAPMKIGAALKLERQTAVALRPFYDYFGMTPFGRAKIRLPKAPKPVSKWAGVLR